MSCFKTILFILRRYSKEQTQMCCDFDYLLKHHLHVKNCTTAGIIPQKQLEKLSCTQMLTGCFPLHTDFTPTSCSQLSPCLPYADVICQKKKALNLLKHSSSLHFTIKTSSSLPYFFISCGGINPRDVHVMAIRNESTIKPHKLL